MLAGKLNVCTQISTREADDQLRAAWLLTDDLPLLALLLKWSTGPTGLDQLLVGTICLKLST